MIAISLHRVSKGFPSGPLFSELSWEIQLGRKIGFVGANGVGKTTLLGIMAGDVEPDGER